MVAAVVVVIGLVVFAGTETAGVFAARRALAGTPPVAATEVVLDIDRVDVTEPWGAGSSLDLALRSDDIIAVGYGGDGSDVMWRLTQDGWVSEVTPSAATKLAVPDESSVVTAIVSADGITVGVGYQDNSLPFLERHTPAIWHADGSGAAYEATIDDLESLGFGYAVGGFRTPHGFENVVGWDGGYLAYTGLLQVWDGFGSEGLNPTEAWAALVALSASGREWTADVLPGFGIYQVVPLGSGLLAAGTDKVENTTTFALFYSSDGRTWAKVVGSPELGKPLLSVTDNGMVIVVDEYQAEDPTTDATSIFVIAGP